MRLLLILPLAGLLMLAACGSPPPLIARNGSIAPGGNGAVATPVATTPVANEVDVRQIRRALSAQEAASYLGDAACASCHRAAAAVHALSRHAHTLRPVSLSQDGDHFRNAQPITDPILHYTYTPVVEQGRCVLRGRNARGQGTLSADYVMGNGHNAYTYLSRDDSKGWVELRLSYYPQVHKWDYTPVQLPGTELSRAAGRVQTNAMLTSCLLCHTTALRATASPAATTGTINTSTDDPLPDLAASSLGVGCERCHGPGRAHVAMVTQEKNAVASSLSARHDTYGMEDLRHASPERINALCGYCHRTAENAPTGSHTESNMARFQSVALARSTCYQRSGVLSCLTCHDAHANADTSLSRNDAICLRCHHTQNTGQKPPHAVTAQIVPLHAGEARQQTSSAQVASEAVVEGKVCPVNTHRGCTTCHMPKQSIDGIPHARYTNHWIKVWRETPSTGDKMHTH